MFDFIYEWIRSLAYYLILMTAILQLIPKKEYKKYIQFYIGLIVILLLCTPIIKVLGLQDDMKSYHFNNTLEQQMKEFEEQTKYLKEVEIDEYYSPEN